MIAISLLELIDPIKKTFFSSLKFFNPKIFNP